MRVHEGGGDGGEEGGRGSGRRSGEVEKRRRGEERQSEERRRERRGEEKREKEREVSGRVGRWKRSGGLNVGRVLVLSNPPCLDAQQVVDALLPDGYGHVRAH